MLGRIESLKVFLEPSSHDRFLRGGELRGRACGARARSCASVRPSVFALARVLVYRMSEHFVFTIRTHTVSFLLIVHFVFTIREGSIYMCVCVFSTVHDSRFGYTGLTTRTPSRAGGTPDGRRRREGERARGRRRTAETMSGLVCSASTASARTTTTTTTTTTRRRPTTAAAATPRILAETKRTRRRRREGVRSLATGGDDADGAMEAAEAIDASIEALRAQTAEEIENMISADAGVRAELERVRNDARNVAETEIDKAEEKEKQRIESAFEEVQQKTGAVQSKAEQAAVETARLKAEAVQQAEAKMAALEAEREALRRELEREESRGGAKWSDDSIDEAAEKMESAKAAVLGGAGGGALATPLILSQGGGVVSIGIAAVSCAVFGVTYRYAVRKDLGNNELKGGVVGAFGLARGLSAADVYLRAASLNGDAAGFETYAQAALLAGQGVLMYAFAALALEQGFSQGFLKPFGDASASKD